MRAIASALVVLAGAVLWGAGAIAATLASGMGSSPAFGVAAVLAGAVVGLIGLSLLTGALLHGRPADPPEKRGRGKGE
jgi:hypothetical protein